MKASQLSESGDTYVVESCVEELIPSQTGPDESKWVLRVEGESKPLILNSTNVLRLVAVMGTDETDDWVGRNVVLYNDPTITYGGSVTGGCRVKAVKSKKRAAIGEKDLTDVPF
jgi:hypothetical protein|tara:strand:- start:16 stop:357 length:342 start_codon:yes stop_codon:yes gene_type:complete